METCYFKQKVVVSHFSDVTKLAEGCLCLAVNHFKLLLTPKGANKQIRIYLYERDNSLIFKIELILLELYCDLIFVFYDREIQTNGCSNSVLIGSHSFLEIVDYSDLVLELLTVEGLSIEQRLDVDHIRLFETNNVIFENLQPNIKQRNNLP